MLTTRRTTSDDPAFVSLVRLLDAELAVRDGADHSFYDQYNKIDMIKHVVIAYDEALPIACGALKEFAPDTMEVKRMFTLPDNRGKGAASLILHELETWAAELSFKRCILETGTKQPEAIALYKKSGYVNIANYGQYAGVENSICFEKILS